MLSPCEEGKTIAFSLLLNSVGDEWDWTTDLSTCSQTLSYIPEHYVSRFGHKTSSCCIKVKGSIQGHLIGTPYTGADIFGFQRRVGDSRSFRQRSRMRDSFTSSQRDNRRGPQAIVGDSHRATQTSKPSFCLLWLLHEYRFSYCYKLYVVIVTFSLISQI